MPEERRSHLAPFLEGPEPWFVVARNAIPAIGVYGLDWTSDIALLEIWFDGITALTAMLALGMVGFLRNDPDAFELPRALPRIFHLPLLIFLGLIALLILGIPYWFTFAVLATMVFEADFWAFLPGRTDVVIALIAVAVGNLIEHARLGFGGLTDDEIRKDFDWEFHGLVARIPVLIFLAFLVPVGGIILFVLVLSYVEIYPMRLLRFLGAETLDPANQNRSLD